MGSAAAANVLLKLKKKKTNNSMKERYPSFCFFLPHEQSGFILEGNHQSTTAALICLTIILVSCFFPPFAQIIAVVERACSKHSIQETHDSYLPLTPSNITPKVN